MSNSNDDFTEISTKKQEYFKRYIVYFYRNIALFFAFSGLVSFIFSQEPLILLATNPISFIIFVILPFIAIVFLSFKVVVIPFSKAHKIFYLLSSFIGILNFILLYSWWSRSNIHIFATKYLFITSFMFLISAFYGQKTRKDILNVSTLLVMFLFSILTALATESVFDKSILELQISISTSIIYFSMQFGLIIFNIKKITNMYYNLENLEVVESLNFKANDKNNNEKEVIWDDLLSQKIAILAVLITFINFLNLFFLGKKYSFEKESKRLRVFFKI